MPEDNETEEAKGPDSNSNAHVRSKDFKTVHVIAVSGLIVTLWTLSYIIIWTYFDDLDKASKFGGIFGAVAALFTGFALAGVVIAILLQRKELELQREELRLTRKELSRTAVAQEASEKALAKQAEALALTATINSRSFMPLILVDIERTHEFPMISFQNLGKLPAYAMFIMAIGKYDESETSEAHFRAKFPGDFQLMIDDDSEFGRSYCINDQFHAQILPPDMRLKAELRIPLFPLTLSILIQFQEAQSKSFSQVFHFLRGRGAYESVIVSPTTPVDSIYVYPESQIPVEKDFRSDLIAMDGSKLPEHIGKSFAPDWARSIPSYAISDKFTESGSRFLLTRIGDIQNMRGFDH